MTRIKKLPDARPPKLPHGFLWRRDGSRRSRRMHSEIDGCWYWTYELFGGPKGDGFRRVWCMETDDLDLALKRVAVLDDLIAWPPARTIWTARDKSEHERSEIEAARWHFEDKWLQSLVRIGAQAQKELRARLSKDSDSLPYLSRRRRHAKTVRSA